MRDTKLSTFVVTRKVGLRFVKALTYAYVFLIVVGSVGWRRVLFRRDQRALLLHNGVLFGSVWMYFADHGALDIRYFLPIVIISLPFVALGLLRAAEWLGRLGERFRVPVPRKRYAAVLSVLGVVGMAGLPDAGLSAHPLMVQQAGLGRWILRNRGPGQTIMGPRSGLRLLAYYSQGTTVQFPWMGNGDAGAVIRVIRRNRPGVVFFWDDPLCPRIGALQTEVVAECLKLGYETVPADQLTDGCGRVRVLEARGPGGRTARCSVRQPRLHRH